VDALAGKRGRAIKMFFKRKVKEPEISLCDNYPRLWGFLKGYFPPGEYDYASDEELIESEIGTGCGFEEAVIEAKQLLSEPNFPWNGLSKAANRVFDDGDEAKKWLEHIIVLVEDALARDVEGL
jgi:hypothetical protein